MATYLHKKQNRIDFNFNPHRFPFGIIQKIGLYTIGRKMNFEKIYIEAGFRHAETKLAGRAKWNKTWQITYLYYILSHNNLLLLKVTYFGGQYDEC